MICHLQMFGVFSANASSCLVGFFFFAHSGTISLLTSQWAHPATALLRSYSMFKAQQIRSSFARLQFKYPDLVPTVACWLLLDLITIKDRISASACSADRAAYFGRLDDSEDRAVFCRKSGVDAQDEGKHKEYSRTSAKVGNNRKGGSPDNNPEH